MSAHLSITYGLISSGGNKVKVVVLACNIWGVGYGQVRQIMGSGAIKAPPLKLKHLRFMNVQWKLQIFPLF